jgi:putative flippase GtrA
MLMKSPKWLAKAYSILFAHGVVRFAFVGGIGFVVNFLMLAVLYDILGLPILLSQLIGAETALLATFIGNNFWAFEGHHHISIKRKLIQFHVTAGFGVLITTTFVVGLVKYGHVYYGLALVVGALAGMVWNYTMNRKVVFRV